MCPFVGVELQRVGQSVHDGRAGVAFAALFEADVVVDAEPGECGEFLPSKPGYTPPARGGGQSDLVGAKACPARA